MPAVAASQARRDLTDELFHALSQPLTALHCAWEVAALRSRSVEEYRQICEQSLLQLEKIEWLVAGLRELSQSVAANKPRVVVALRDVLREQIADLQPLADSRNLHIVMTALAACPVQATAQVMHRALSLLLMSVFEIAGLSSTLTIDLQTAAQSTKLTVAAALHGPFSELTLQDRLHLTLARSLIESLDGLFELQHSDFALSIEIILPSTDC